MKRKSLLALMLAAVLALSACGGGADTKEPEKETAEAAGAEEEAKEEEKEEASAEGVTEISFWHHMEGVNAEALEAVTENFNNTLGKEKGIHVTPSFQGTNTAEKLKTLAQADDWTNFPNTVQIASAGIPVVYDYDIFMKPEDMYAKGEDIILERASIIENNARTFSYDGELCAIPFSNSTILLYYNKDMFTEAGLDPENPPKTISEMAEAIEKLKIVNGEDVERYGLNVQVKRYQLVNWVGGINDFNFLGDSEGGRAGMMTKFTFGEDGSLMNYLDEWEKVIATGGYKPIEDNINEEFALQLFGMAIMSSARISKVDGLVGDSFEWATASLPSVNEDDKGGAAVGGSGVVMFDKGNDAENKASWIFLQYLGGEDAQYDFCTASGYIPMNRDLYESDRMKAYLEENLKMKAAVDQLMVSNPNVQEPFDMVTSEINSIIDEEMVAFAEGSQDKQTTHDNIVNKCNEKIQTYVEVNAE